MALDSVPWFIDGGAKHSGAVARTLAYAATGGATGIISPADLKVQALPTPGTAVQVLPGAAVMVNRFPGARNEAYTARNSTATEVEVPATGSSGGATRFLILRVDDPEFAGGAPADPQLGPYVHFEWVNSITNLAYPFVALAKLTQPANTATITNAMLTDLRILANPRTQRIQKMTRGIPTTDLTTQLPYFQDWPHYVPQIDIPEWATHVQATLQVFGVGIVSAATLGDWELVIGWAPGPVLISDLSTYDFNEFGTGANPMRAPAMGVIIDKPIPESMRGTTQTIRGRGGRSLASGGGFIRSDHQTQIAFDVWFSEEPI